MNKTKIKILEMGIKMNEIKTKEFEVMVKMIEVSPSRKRITDMTSIENVSNGTKSFHV